MAKRRYIAKDGDDRFLIIEQPDTGGLERQLGRIFDSRRYRLFPVMPIGSILAHSGPWDAADGEVEIRDELLAS